MLRQSVGATSVPRMVNDRVSPRTQQPAKLGEIRPGIDGIDVNEHVVGPDPIQPSIVQRDGTAVAKEVLDVQTGPEPLATDLKRCGRNIEHVEMTSDPLQHGPPRAAARPNLQNHPVMRRERQQESAEYGIFPLLVWRPLFPALR